MIFRNLQTIYCDDIRQEVSGKLSYIGAYSTSLIVASFPITLPKLCVSIRIISPVQNPIESLTVQILKDDEVLQELVIDDEQLAKSRESIPNLSSDEQQDGVQVFHAMTAFSPIQFDGPCALRVRAQTEDEEIRGVGLKVEQVSTKD